MKTKFFLKEGMWVETSNEINLIELNLDKPILLQGDPIIMIPHGVIIYIEQTKKEDSKNG